MKNLELPERDAPGRAARLGWSTFLALAVFAFLVPRLLYIARGELSGDEAIFGLMALEIGRGESYPLYCWGAHYASALVSYMAAPLIAVFGPTPFAMRLAVLPWGVAQILLTAFFFRRRFGATEGVLAALTVAMALPEVMTFSVMAHGGYPETFFLGLGTWVVALDLLERSTASRAALLGFLAGLSFAIFWLGIPMLVAVVVLFMSRRVLDRRAITALAAGGAVGSLPVWVYNLWIAPGSTFARLAGRSLEAGRSEPLGEAIMARLASAPEWLTEAGVGLDQLFAPVGGVVALAVLVLLAAWGGFRLLRAGRPEGVLVLAFLAALLAFNFAGNLNRIRHWTLLWFVLPWAWMGLGVRLRRGLIAVILVIVASNVPSWVRDVPNDPHARAVADLVARERADALVADYDIGYPAAYRLGGRVMIAAVAPPNPSDRRPDWTERIRESSKRPALLMPLNAAWKEVVADLHNSGYRDVAVHFLPSRVLLVAEAPGRSLVDPVSSRKD